MGIKYFLTESYRSPVLAALLVFILPFVYSILTNKDWIGIFYSIPKIFWIFIAFLLLFWIIIIAIRRKMSYYSFPVGFIPTFGWNRYGGGDV